MGDTLSFSFSFISPFALSAFSLAFSSWDSWKMDMKLRISSWSQLIFFPPKLMPTLLPQRWIGWARKVGIEEKSWRVQAQSSGNGQWPTHPGQMQIFVAFTDDKLRERFIVHKRHPFAESQQINLASIATLAGECEVGCACNSIESCTFVVPSSTWQNCHYWLSQLDQLQRDDSLAGVKPLPRDTTPFEHEEIAKKWPTQAIWVKSLRKNTCCFSQSQDKSHAVPDLFS